MTVLKVSAIAKSYGATVALRSISFDVQPGEVHALLGENGAGKSTFVKILSGIVQPDEGRIDLDGNAYRARSVLEARRFGISTAFQELSLLPNLNVATNLVLPRPLKGSLGFLSRSRNEERAEELLRQFNATDISPRIIVNRLSLAERQRVEIIRACSHRPRLILLDEPTAALAEPKWLFEIVEGLIASGTAALYISHRLSEVRRLCKRGTILRNGESVGTIDIPETRDGEIFRLMVGSRSVNGTAITSTSPSSEIAIEAKGLSGKTIRDIDFRIAKSEIVGLAALEGQGQRELFRILGGLATPRSGMIAIDGKNVRLKSPRDAINTGSGIGFVPEERKSEGVFLGRSTKDNITLPLLGRLNLLGLINQRREYAAALKEIPRVQLPERFLGMRIAALSGGNQQKALLLRVLLSGARNLVLFDPSRGVDVGTKQVIYDVVRRFARDGGSVFIYSTELPELVGLAHRCLVLYRGAIAGEVSGDALTEQNLVALATGHTLADTQHAELT